MNPGINNLHFLKLGGSLITDKDRAHTARRDAIARLAEEIAAGREMNTDLPLVLGHGSGSFGHVAGKKYGTRQGVSSRDEWMGFVEVWHEANALNRIVMDVLMNAGLPAVAFPPSASVISKDGVVKEWNLAPLVSALKGGLLPVVFGDVAFDSVRGGTILSTEDLFAHLAVHLRPRRVLLAGLEKGVWADFPTCEVLLKEVTPGSIEKISASLGGSRATDVTGGMLTKVLQSLELVGKVDGLEVLIFSGEEAGAVEKIFSGERLGTLIHGGKENPHTY
jgi:isopentenyl phosphate kinase